MNERRYVFGSETGPGQGWVCAKIPQGGRLYKDCVPKDQAPAWYEHLQENRDYQVTNTTGITR